MSKSPSETQVDATHHDDPSDKAALRQDTAADQANHVETSLSIRDAFRYYWKAVAWSVCVSNATIMESYMLLLANSFYAQPQFQRRFGEQLPNGSYSIPARWQIGVSMAGLVGLIIGVFGNGYFADRWGLRKVMIACHAAILAFVFVLFFAQNIQTILVGGFLISVPCGFFAAATPTYAAEVTPLRLRGYLTVYVNLCWVIGKLICFGILAGTLSLNSQWAYKIPYAIQWAWPVPLAIATFLAPESPWWLVRKGRFEEAERSLSRLVAAPRDTIDPKDTLSLIIRTVEGERAHQIQGSYFECFKGTNLRRTEIAMVSWGCQILPGLIIQNYITYFFTLAGLKTADSFYLSIGNAGLAFVGTVSSWFVMTRFGWKTVYLGGLCAMIPVMGLVGFLDLATNTPNGDTVRWGQCSLLLIWFFIYGISIGPIPYSIAANVGAANLRAKTIALGRNTYYFLSIINTVVSPYFLNPKELDLKGKAAFLPWGLTVCMVVWTYFRLPELKGMTQETLNNLFDAKVSARKFKEASKEYQ
ncbi:general substrate transporter [Plectosphaerella cucumerina]|uniref:General substrate transporter n=1 Tax=Plectosphaerella cucumerina TaxID=40658 RepID=A0A8K0TJ07_9PEZI|nr:general substrate transporter [Plectosphaerella cucumerina]